MLCLDIFELNRDLLVGLHVGTEVDLPEGAAPQLAADAELVADARLHRVDGRMDRRARAEPVETTIRGKSPETHGPCHGGDRDRFGQLPLGGIWGREVGLEWIGVRNWGFFFFFEIGRAHV